MKDLNEKRANEDLAGLHQWVRKLLALANETTQHIQYSEDDHFGFMALCFLFKQIDHMKSILLLKGARDVELIARSMLEGMCQLLWAANNPNSRAQWRTFAWIHDWRTMNAQIAAGEPVDPKKRSSIEEAIRQYGNQFLKPSAKKALKRGEPLPDNPYYDNWTGHSAREIFDSIKGGEILYQKLYKPFSDWHHWSPAGLGYAITREHNWVIYSRVSAADFATALATGFQCLLQTIEVVDEHFGLGITSRIAKIKNGYLHRYEAHRKGRE